MQTFNMKTTVNFGLNALHSLKQLEGTHAFIVADETMQKLGFVKQVEEMLIGGGFVTNVFDDVLPDPTAGMVGSGLQELLKQVPDVIVAIGGGSVIDAAKGILYAFANLTPKHQKMPKLVAIPTTSGTGSEVTSFSVITTQNEKLAIVDELMMPDVAIVDPLLVKTVPPSVTADTGLDALSHAIEAYVSTNATDFTDALAEKAIALLFEHLITAYKNGDDLAAREKVHNASTMAGMAFTNASLGITHSLAHAIGNEFHLPHGMTIGILLPHVMTYNANLTGQVNEQVVKKYANLAKIIGLPSDGHINGCKTFIKAVTVLLSELGVHGNFGACGINEQKYNQALPTIAALAMKDNCTKTNPRVPTLEELILIAKGAY